MLFSTFCGENRSLSSSALPTLSNSVETELLVFQKDGDGVGMLTPTVAHFTSPTPSAVAFASSIKTTEKLFESEKIRSTHKEPLRPWRMLRLRSNGRNNQNTRFSQTSHHRRRRRLYHFRIWNSLNAWLGTPSDFPLFSVVFSVASKSN